jgi:hypothetical protein
MKLLSALLLTWAAITVGGVFLACVIVLFADMHAKSGWTGVAVLAALLSGFVALPFGLALRLKG